MAEIVLFHHVQGLTSGVREFADTLRQSGHVVHVPDLFEGATFGSIGDGLAFVQDLGFGTVLERGQAAVADLPAELVYAGFSLGVMPAQMLTQTRPGARAALLYHSCVPASEFGRWPDGVPAQIHSMDHDPSFTEEGDIDAARALADENDQVELFLYPGRGHLFADPSSSDYDEKAAALLTERSLDLLSRLS